MEGDQLPAGRDLDVLIHRRVFDGDGGEVPEAPGPPRYSTDLAASWRLAERLHQQGYRVDVDTWAGGAATVTLTSPVDDPRTFAGETPAHALCRAALAVSEE